MNEDALRYSQALNCDRENDMENEKINIKGVPETMLQTLYARAKESRKERHSIYDEKAIEIVEKLDYDFSSADKDLVMSSGVLSRTIVLDKIVGEHLSKNSDTVVVNIACGLDTRCYRMEGKFKRWYNLDLPEVIAVRERFLRENGAISQIARSAMDKSWAWDIEQTTEPVLIIIEGLTMYLSEAEVKQIFSVIESRFVHAVVFVETMSPFVVKHIKEKSIEESQAKFSWGIKGGKELEKLLHGFRSVRDISLIEGMKMFSPIYKVIGKIGFVRNFSDSILIMERE